jgi:putative endonuclease
MLASKRDGVLYIGVTNDLVRRVFEHRTGTVLGFTRTYNVHHLVWFEAHETMPLAIAREKQIKRWHRAWKVALIEERNPAWHDLFEEIAT